MEIPASIAAEQGALRQNIALSVIKSAAESDRKIAGILEDAIDNVPSSSLRGSNVNVLA